MDDQFRPTCRVGHHDRLHSSDPCLSCKCFRTRWIELRIRNDTQHTPLGMSHACAESAGSICPSVRRDQPTCRYPLRKPRDGSHRRAVSVFERQGEATEILGSSPILVPARVEQKEIGLSSRVSLKRSRYAQCSSSNSDTSCTGRSSPSIAMPFFSA